MIELLSVEPMIMPLLCQACLHSAGVLWGGQCPECGAPGVGRQRGMIRPLIRGAIGSGVQQVGKRFNMRA